MVLHLGTKKKYFGQKEPKYFKKSQNQLIDYLKFCPLFDFKFSMIKIFLWTKTVLYRLFPFCDHPILAMLMPPKRLR